MRAAGASRSNMTTIERLQASLARQRDAAILRQNPRVTALVRKQVIAEIGDPSALKAEIEALKAENEKHRARIAELEKTDGENVQKIVALEAERDQWRKQALEENAAADAATGTKKRTRKARQQ